MFKKTHIRLTLINSLVFIILMGSLGSVIYVYTAHQLYRDVNQSLKETAGFFQDQRLGSKGENEPPMKKDPRILTLIWDKNHQLISQGHDAEVFNGNESHIKPKVYNKLTDIEVGNFSFRYIAFQVNTSIGKVTIQALRNINSEKELLHRLLLIMLIGCGVGVICAVVSGYFLAGGALVPIKKAWLKQQQFVSDASHELRTPLAVIQAKTDLLFRAPSATIQDKIIDVSTISNESRRLSKLVSNLLTLARSDSDQLEVKKQMFRLDELLSEILQQFEEIVAYQGKSMVVENGGPISFFADKERIHQLVIILLDNAIKFTKEGGSIRLSCSQTHSSIILQVQDSGIGIAEKDIPKIFDRFYQGDKSRTNAEGTGLGLSIAKWIIDKHHGRVKVTSILGDGTLIEIAFPKAQKG